MAMAAEGDAQGKMLPEGFVYVDVVCSAIGQSIRYSTAKNFMGRPAAGYKGHRAILSVPAAAALARVQTEDLSARGLRLKIYDSYRPQRAVDDFARWALDLEDVKEKDEYYPDVPKEQLFARGYIAHKSGHSRGSTVDLTLQRRRTKDGAEENDPESSTAHSLWEDVDMGSPWDFFGPISHPDCPSVSAEQRANRDLLRHVMGRQGFQPYEKEWWHFTMEPEMFPDTYWDFVVR